MAPTSLARTLLPTEERRSKKDAQPLGIYLQNDGNAGNRIEGDMILANTILTLQ